MNRKEIEQFIDKVERLEALGREMAEQSAGFPALNRNAERLLASVKMMKMNLGLPHDGQG